MTPLISQLRHISAEMKARDAQIQSLLKRNGSRQEKSIDVSDCVCVSLSLCVAELEQEVDSLKKRGNQQVTRTGKLKLTKGMPIIRNRFDFYF